VNLKNTLSIVFGVVLQDALFMNFAFELYEQFHATRNEDFLNLAIALNRGATAKFSELW